MSATTRPHVRIPVGVVVERCRATSPWLESVWRPVAVLCGLPDAAPWTALGAEENAATFYIGAAEIELYRTETDHYRANLVSGAPSVWVALRPTGVLPAYDLFAVTAGLEIALQKVGHKVDLGAGVRAAQEVYLQRCGN